MTTFPRVPRSLLDIVGSHSSSHDLILISCRLLLSAALHTHQLRDILDLGVSTLHSTCIPSLLSSSCPAVSSRTQDGLIVCGAKSVSCHSHWDFAHHTLTLNVCLARNLSRTSALTPKETSEFSLFSPVWWDWARGWVAFVRHSHLCFRVSSSESP